MPAIPVGACQVAAGWLGKTAIKLDSTLPQHACRVHVGVQCICQNSMFAMSTVETDKRGTVTMASLCDAWE